MLIEKYYEILKKNGLNKSVNVPNDMKVGSEDKEGWVKWKPIKSMINENDIINIENKYKIHLPKEYINFIQDKQFLDIQIGNYTIYGINSLNSLDKIASFLPENILKKGFFPIGHINDSDYIVLDTTNNKIVRLSFDDYSPIEILSESFTMFLDFLQQILKK